MDSTHPPLVRTRLSAMMFLEFFIWGSWWIPLAGYSDNLGFSGNQHGWLMATTAMGAIISPLFVGLIADRFFSAQRVLCVLHILGGLCLIGAGCVGEGLIELGSGDKFPPLMGLMLLNSLFFMPTLALCNAVAFKHIPDAAKFPRIAMFGSIGWIVTVLIVGSFLGGMKAPTFLFQGGVAGIVLGFYCLSLPNTPPKGAEAGGDVFGLSALKLLKESSFLIFIVCVFLVSIPACGYFFALIGPILQQRDYPSPLGLTTLCQFAEIVFLFSMPWFVARIGLKRVLMIGMLAWGVRYLCFAFTGLPEYGFALALVGLLLHGFCYSFLYVGAYMYVDQRAPQELKASAQSLLTFLLIGVGMFLGAKGAGEMKGKYVADVAGMPAVKISTSEKNDTAGLPRWNDPDSDESVFRFLNLSKTVNWLRGIEEEKTPDLTELFDADQNGWITLAEIDEFDRPEFEVDGMKFKKDDLMVVFTDIHAKRGVPEEDGLNRDHWIAVQVNDWQPIWLYPAIFIFIILAVFAVAFRDKASRGK